MVGAGWLLVLLWRFPRATLRDHRTWRWAGWRTRWSGRNRGRPGHHRGRHHRHGHLAQIAGKYTFLLFNADGLAENVFWGTFLGCVFIAVLTWVCYVGIEASARTQYFLLGAEIVTLVIFSVVALGRVWFGDVRLSWLNRSLYVSVCQR